MTESRFATQCRILVELLAEQDDGQLDDDQEQALKAALSSVSAELPSLVDGRLPAGCEPEDVAQEAISRFVVAIGRRQVDATLSPAGYLLRTAANVIRDHGRRRTPPTDPLPDLEVTYGRPGTERDADELSRLIDKLASAERVRRALAIAASRGETTVLAVIHEWLNQASVLGDAPPSRAVAEAVGVSKTSVANALQRFRTCLEEVG